MERTAQFETYPAAPRAIPEVAVDMALCGACRAEMLDTANRRFGFGLISCARCGPRYSILRQAPYERANTTMAPWTMCAECLAEYNNPTDRRFGDQAISCLKCGPRVSLVDPSGAALQHDDPILGAIWRLSEGQVLAIKGMGGFHLAVRADDEDAVRRLRQRLGMAEPFSLMCGSLDEARQIVTFSETTAALLSSPAAPTVQASRKAGSKIANSVAWGSHRWGVMLPQTPIQHMLFNRGAAWWPALVMISAHGPDGTLVIDNEQALEHLGKMRICDALLWHERPIARGVEDAVFIDMGETTPLPKRRGRGFVPSTLALPNRQDASVPTGLCLGGQGRNGVNTLALVLHGQVILHPQVEAMAGDGVESCLSKPTREFLTLLKAEPQWIAHDSQLHKPGSTATGNVASMMHLPALPVAHHHAHTAAVLAEHGQKGPVLALVCDENGYAFDDAIWGGELLIADLLTCKRIGSLRPLRIPTNITAEKETRGRALAWLAQAWGVRAERHQIAMAMFPDEQERAMLFRLIQEGQHCKLSSSAGDYFAATAAILGLCTQIHFEEQAVAALEAAANSVAWSPPEEEGLFDIHAYPQESFQEIDLCRLQREMLVRRQVGWSKGQLAALFHEEFARAWFTVIRRAARRTGLSTIVLTGGVFINERLSQRLTQLLEMHDLKVLRHRVVPPNDEGLALGQAAVASAQIARGIFTLKGLYSHPRQWYK